MSELLVFGAGYLGRRLARELAGAELSLADITDPSAITAALAEHCPRVVINAAGKTGRPNVDWCESHQTETQLVNVVGPLLLARACEASGAHLVHLGSGCIFYGRCPHEGGFREDHFANPIAFYSRTKYAADLVLSRLPHVAIARLRMPIDGTPHPRNLITKLAGYSSVIDVENSVTVIEDLVQAIARIAEVRATGIFHVVNPGVMRHRDLIDLYRELVDPTCRPELIAEDELVKRGLAHKARSNCILSDARLAGLGVTMRPIEVALRRAMEEYAIAARQT